MKVLVKGAGVAGLALAWELTRRGAGVTVIERRDRIAGNASWHAGGMLAPWCERESAEEPVLTFGRAAADWWDAALPGHVTRNGTLVLAPARDRTEFDRFGRRTSGHERLDAAGIAALEPDLAGRFSRGLHFPAEAHLDPRLALTALTERLGKAGAHLAFGYGAVRGSSAFDFEADCTGMAAKRPDLRGVRGEMLLLRTPDIKLSRPIRLLHPRIPIYVVPRAGNVFMIGATMVESASAGPITARSMMELLNTAYALHPAFAEAEVVETGVGIRPAFSDNFPRVARAGNKLSVNGLYRHGFLLAPAMARQAADFIFDGQHQDTAS